ncbi:tryptophan halogenase family protein [Caulobacter sp. X]|uniref:tryptophan halogenase family protein n=1 Tax=Caulobacter sp. X TaxID=2048901 RepID=UPI00191BBA55|nr:tryptophan halogenase family protein [Caulobacter sp. X]
MGPRAKRIIILGGGTAGWVCGSILARNARSLGLDVVVVDTAEIPTIGVGEASIPTIYDLLRHVGIDDRELVSRAGATFKYGIEFEGWSVPGDRYMHGFGSMGAPLGELEFFNAWAAAANYFTSRDLGPFVPAVAAARKGRFGRVRSRPADALDHQYFPLCELSYALHFDASLLARLLREKAMADGARHLSLQVAGVETDETGIVALTTSDSGRLDADLFVDCSGLYGFLSRKALGGRFDDWRAYLPCDRAIAVQSRRHTEPRPYTRSVAHRAGWRWEIQLQDRTGNGNVYCSDFMNDDQAETLLRDQVEGELIGQPRKIEFATGRLSAPWHANCIAIGLSAGFLEPLESTSIHLIYKYALRLEEALRGGELSPVVRERFNAAWRAETEEIRDFLMAHYVVNQRSEDGFWSSMRAARRPTTLEDKLESFARTGWIALPDEALFGHDSWFQVLIGQKFQVDYKGLATSPQRASSLLQFLENVGRAVDIETSSLPHSHGQYLQQLRLQTDPSPVAG